ncbi:MAG: 4Fe-4S dicluster domain-containing protein [Acidobacteriota bacterium]|jgi:polyferredoxin|nr:4Fe-4S dicluster domain-containing protein [Acidobacteriota bacterium]
MSENDETTKGGGVGQPAAPAKPSGKGGTLRLLRRASQIVFLILFLVLFFKTEYRGESGAEMLGMDAPVSVFLEMDPLVAFATALSTHTLYGKVVFALFLVVGVILLGRFFCGWICPLGAINQIFSRFKPERKGMKRIDSNRFKPWMHAKYYVLFVMTALALFTSLQTGLLDPIPFLVRSLAAGVMPGIDYALRHALDAMYASNVGVLGWAADAGYAVLGNTVLSYKPQYFNHAVLIGAIFLFVLVMNRFITRFWCRGVCPLGAFLGLISRYAVFGIQKDHARCNNCNLCLRSCQGGCDPQGGVPLKQADCLLCFNCESVCPKGAVKFKFFPEQEAADVRPLPDLRRRRVMESVAAGVVALPLLRASLGLEKNTNSRLLRPPGSLEETEFLARCVRCGQCMKACPTNAIQPTLLEAGVEGLWTPMLVMRVGSCEYNCVQCSQVCPTGAIWKMTEAEKHGKVARPGVSGQPKPVKIGTAFYDRGRCLPWAMDIPCIVCEEFCPTSPKAIWVIEEQVQKSDGSVITVQRPRVDVDRCVGCGTCENVCPVQDRPAVYVTSIGETRSRTNQIRLESGAYK